MADEANGVATETENSLTGYLTTPYTKHVMHSGVRTLLSWRRFLVERQAAQVFAVSLSWTRPKQNGVRRSHASVLPDTTGLQLMYSLSTLLTASFVTICSL